MGEKPTNLDAAESAGIAAGDINADSPPDARPGEAEERAANLNLSKSNIDRSMTPPADQPADAINLNSSKSNVAKATGGKRDDDPIAPAEATNLNSSRSNIYRTGPAAPAPGPAQPSPGPAEPGPGPAQSAGP